MKTIKQILNEQLEANKKDLAEHEAIKAALSSQNGKPLVSKLEKHLPEGYKMDFRHTLCHVKSPSGRSHLLGWMSNPVLNIEKLDDINTAYCIGAKERISQIEGFLNNPERLRQLTSLFMKVKKSWESFKKVANELEFSKMESYHNPAYHELLRNFEVPAGIISDIRFNNIKLV